MVALAPLSKDKESQTKTTRSEVPEFDQEWKFRKWFDLKIRINF